MTGRNGSQRKGLFGGFLTGTAVCLCLGAAASYVRPLSVAPSTPVEPTAATTDIEPNAPKDVTTEVVIITPKSDSARQTGEAPDNEAPEADRDDASVAASVRELNEPVQTETPQIEAPVAIDQADVPTSDATDSAPQIATAAPLETNETAPEQTLAQVDVSTGNVVTDVPSTEESDLEQPQADDAPITLALNTPKVETSERDDAVSLPQASESNEENQAPQTESPKPSAPTAPAAPAAEPVIALSEPVQTPIAEPVTAAPLAEPVRPEPNSSDQSAEPALTTPEVTDTTPNTPQTEPQTGASTTAPRQVETPTIDAEPEAPIINQAASPAPEPEPDDAQVAAVTPPAQAEDEPQKPQENQVVDRRNPPPPTFEGRAFDAFAVSFTPPNDKPYLTIILEHVGEGSVNMYDLLNFGQPVTFGVNTTDELAKWRENEFRRGGFEVVATVPSDDDVGLSESMDEQEIPTRLEEYLTAVPGAVAVLDASDSDLYRDPRKVSSVATELEKSGRGLVIHEKFGVNQALEAARSAEIPAASLVRIIDAQRDASSIRRALDRAALDASKTGATIVFGRTYPETVAAILPWLLGNSARAVTMAPLTATMERMVE